MQKIIIGLLVVFLLGIFVYISSSDTEKQTEDTKIPALVEKKGKSITREIMHSAVDKTGDMKLEKKNITMHKKPFVPQIDLSSNDAPRRVATEADIEEIASKTDRELQKEIFADIELRMTAEMKAMPDCLENAQNKKEAIHCGKKLQDINREFELILGIERGPSAGDHADGFVWSEKTKEGMIQQLDAGIESMQELFSCIQASDTDKEQEKCFEVDQH